MCLGDQFGLMGYDLFFSLTDKKRVILFPLCLEDKCYVGVSFNSSSIFPVQSRSSGSHVSC